MCSVGRHDEAARVAMTPAAQRSQLGVGLAQDARQAVGGSVEIAVR
jgi:hypothetical protein